MKKFLCLIFAFAFGSLFAAQNSSRSEQLLLRIFGQLIDIESILNKFDQREKNKLAQKAKDNEDNESEILPVDPSEISDTLDSLVLNEETRKNLSIITKYLKNPEIFQKVGAQTPKAYLLEGPPGNGKTSVGRALAKESGCKFYLVSGSELDNKLVGVGANRLRNIFKEAKKNAPSIIFIDEIDTIAKMRVSEESRFHSQTLQQLLIEMDGFVSLGSNGKPVLVIGSTNNLNHIDSAILSRFPIQVHFPNPNLENRFKMLKLYSLKLKKSRNLNDKALMVIAKRTEGFSGRDLKDLVNRAALNAIMNNKDQVNFEDLEASVVNITTANEIHFLRSKL